MLQTPVLAILWSKLSDRFETWITIKCIYKIQSLRYYTAPTWYCFRKPFAATSLLLKNDVAGIRKQKQPTRPLNYCLLVNILKSTTWYNAFVDVGLLLSYPLLQPLDILMDSRICESLHRLASDENHLARTWWMRSFHVRHQSDSQPVSIRTCCCSHQCI